MFSQTRQVFDKEGLDGVGKMVGKGKGREVARVWIYAAFLCHSKLDDTGASSAAHSALEADAGCLVARYTSSFFDKGASAKSVYDGAEAFRAFIRGGGNVALYRNLAAAMSSKIAAVVASKKAKGDPLRLLDIGVGDGMALLPVLEALGDETPAQVTIVEPSRRMIETTKARIEAMGGRHGCRAFNTALQAFEAIPEVSGDRWDVAEATFSLQSIPPPERVQLLRWVAERTPTLMIAEFDVPACFSSDPLSPASASRVIDVYEAGLAEYSSSADGELVAHGFLVPVMLGYVSTQPTNKTNFEVPISSWISDLRSAGFGRFEVVEVFDYWWSPCRLIVAQNP